MFEKFRRNPHYLDFFEQAVLSIIFCWFAYGMLNNLLKTGSPIAALYLFDQIIVLAFILVRRKTNSITQSGWDWFVGFAGTFLAMLITAAPGRELVAPVVTFLISASGVLLHLAAKLTLRRSMGVVAANRGVKDSGPYRFVRHPMYAGYILVHVGLLLAWPTLWNLMIILACWTLFLSRIIAEERVLADDPHYRAMQERTKFRLVPGIY